VALGVAVATGEPAPLAPGPGVSPALVGVVTRAMARRPEDRFPGAVAMREALALA
jgi:hypothetical protein